MLYSPYVINRLPAFWGPDAEDFRCDKAHRNRGVCFRMSPPLIAVPLGFACTQHADIDCHPSPCLPSTALRPAYLLPRCTRPRRWLEAAKLPSPYSYISFNAGPRICLGQRLAELEGVYVLAGLLSTFDLQLARDTTVPASYTFSASLPMAGGLPVYVRARQRA